MPLQEEIALYPRPPLATACLGKKSISRAHIADNVTGRFDIGRAFQQRRAHAAEHAHSLR